MDAVLPVENRRSRSRTFLSVLLIALVLTTGGASSAYLAGLRQSAPLREPEPRRFNVEVFVVQPADLQELVAAFGTVHADKRVVVSAQVAGEVIDVHPQLKVGAAMAAPEVVVSGSGESIQNPGDVLATIDPRNYEERVVQVEGRISEARAELRRLDQEERNLERLTNQLGKDLQDLEQEYAKIADLSEKKIATDSDLRRAKMELRGTETLLIQNQNERDLVPSRREQILRRIATLQNDLEVAKLDRERTSVRAPFSGRLMQVLVERGQYVRPGDPLAELADASIVEVPLAVSLDEYARLVPFVRAGRFPDVALADSETSPARWHGRLLRVSPQADERTRTVMIYVQVDNREQETPLLPGMFVQARIDGTFLPQSIVVPRDAVLNDRSFIVRDGAAVRVAIQTTRTLRNLAMIAGGFAIGDRMILSNLDVLYDGAPVNVVMERTLKEELERQPAPLVRIID